MFLDFLRSISEIQIFKMFAPSIELLNIDDFSIENENDYQYYIWNNAFEWKFDYRKRQTEMNGKKETFYYMSMNDAPVIEYTRHNFNDERNYGRIYWGKFFAAPNGLNYDIVKFD